MAAYVIRADMIIDGTRDVPDTGKEVVVADGLIRAIVPVGTTDAGDAEVVDLPGMALVPGLIDCHEHLGLIFGEDEMEQGLDAPEYYAMKSALHMQQILRSGVTTVRTAGDPGDTGNLIKRALRHGIITGPRLVSAHRLIARTGGHGWVIGREADGPWALRAAIRDEVRRGADVIKIMVSGGAATVGSDVYAPDMTDEEIVACIDEAHRLGRRIMAHGHGGPGIAVAVEAGVDSIEHGLLLTEADYDLMKERGTYLTATSAYGVKALEMPSIPEYVKEKLRDTIEQALESLRYAARIGLKVAVGTDSLHGKVWEELDILSKHGFTPLEALRAGTINGADLIGMADKIGTIEVGKVADIVAAPGNPLDDFSVLDMPAFVMKDGQIAHTSAS
ncbi:metal-dependent hydrolase family protein [Georgenia faecalis]|uniref:Amidohydrolase family protein n=1 Tax=Georgenia faecalis TaxID=2483799 RepID=A0ABV9D9U0_9MICO|nr:amidohydrolase family protein [Georgenia faecalis]